MLARGLQADILLSCTKLLSVAMQTAERHVITVSYLVTSSMLYAMTVQVQDPYRSVMTSTSMSMATGCSEKKGLRVTYSAWPASPLCRTTGSTSLMMRSTTCWHNSSTRTTAQQGMKEAALAAAGSSTGQECYGTHMQGTVQRHTVRCVDVGMAACNCRQTHMTMAMMLLITRHDNAI